MPIRAFLKSHKFDDEIVRLMGLAFEMALASLRHDCPDPLREALARKIIELAKAGERDPERLCDDALKALPLRSMTLLGFPSDRRCRRVRHLEPILRLARHVA